jgi:hypothetical protein
MVAAVLHAVLTRVQRDERLVGEVEAGLLLAVGDLMSWAPAACLEPSASLVGRYVTFTLRGGRGERRHSSDSARCRAGTG